MSAASSSKKARGPTARRVAAYDWPTLRAELDASGYALLPKLLTPDECRATRALYPDDAHFRSRVVMAQHGYGRGEYRYFSYPLPSMVAELRGALYPHLTELGNTWNERLGSDERFPDTHERYLAQCHEAGQDRPTPLLLQYLNGDYNRLHQDLYGDMVFPVQVAVLLSEPGTDFVGGEFLLTEQRPRMQSRAEVVPLGIGDAVAFAVNTRPMQGARGYYRVHMRHGVSRLRAGMRHTLGIIFHDAA